VKLPIRRMKREYDRALEERATKILYRQDVLKKKLTAEEWRVLAGYRRSGRARYSPISFATFVLGQDEVNFLRNLLSHHAPSRSDMEDRRIYDKLVEDLRKPHWFTFQILVPPGTRGARRLRSPVKPRHRRSYNP
jgi:hypothetical protein